MFPSPYSGILFLLSGLIMASVFFGQPFPSPYSGILFLYYKDMTCEEIRTAVSVHLFGDSFFIAIQDNAEMNESYVGFPSPYSGILFLLFLRV